MPRTINLVQIIFAIQVQKAMHTYGAPNSIFSTFGILFQHCFSIKFGCVVFFFNISFRHHK
jgi:hypothetical protein